MEIRRIRQTEAEAVTDLWDEAGQSVPDGGALKERGRGRVAVAARRVRHPLLGRARRAGR